MDMANNDPYSSLTKRLKKLGEPCPLSPMVDLDEDSFVILWRDNGNIDDIKEIISNPFDSELENKIDFKKDEQNVPDTASTASSNSIAMEDLKERIVQLIEENTVFKERLAQNNNLMSVQCANLQHNNNVIERLKKANEDLNGKLDLLRTEFYNLADEKEQLKKVNCSLADDLEQLTKENCHMAEDLKQLSIKKHSQEVEISSLKRAINKCKLEYYEDLDSAKEQIERVETELSRVRSVMEAKEKYLNEEIEKLKSKLLLADEKPSTEEMAEIKEHLNATKVELLLMQQNKVIADQQVDVLAEEILELRSKCQVQHTKADEICALKAQLDLFKADYDTEKAINIELRKENAQFTGELHNLRACSYQLQKEIDDLRHDALHSSFSQTETDAIYTNELLSDDTSGEQPMMCPVCNFGFTTNQALSNHVERCLNHSDSNRQ